MHSSSQDSVYHHQVCGIIRIYGGSIFCVDFVGILQGISISNESWDSFNSLYIQHYIPTDL